MRVIVCMCVWAIFGRANERAMVLAPAGGGWREAVGAGGGRDIREAVEAKEDEATLGGVLAAVSQFNSQSHEGYGWTKIPGSVLHHLF